MVGRVLYEQVPVDEKRVARQSIRVIKEVIAPSGRRMYVIRIMMAGFGILRHVDALQFEKKYENIKSK